MKKSILLLLSLLICTSAYAGETKDKVLAPGNAVRSYVGKVLKGTADSANGFFHATAEFGEEFYRAITVQADK